MVIIIVFWGGATGTLRIPRLQNNPCLAALCPQKVERLTGLSIGVMRSVVPWAYTDLFLWKSES